MKAQPKYEIDHSRTTYFQTVVKGEQVTRKRVVLMLVKPPEPKVVLKVKKPKKPKKKLCLYLFFRSHIHHTTKE